MRTCLLLKKLKVAREQLHRSSISKLDDMLNVQKSVFHNTILGFVESGSTFVVHPPKLVPTTSASIVPPSLFEVKEPKEEVLASRRTRVDLSKSKPKNPNQSRSKKQCKPQWFCHFCGGVGHILPNCFKLQASKQASKQKVPVPKTHNPMALIHELVKVLNLYADTEVEIWANSTGNPNSKFPSKRV